MRSAGTAGIASALLLVPVAVLLLASGYPDPGAPAAEITRYFEAHHTILEVSLLPDLASVVLSVWLAAGVGSRLAGADEAMMASAVIALAAGAAVLVAVEDGALAAIAHGRGAGADTLWPLAHFGVGVTIKWFYVGVLVAAALGGHRSGAFSRPFVVLAVMAAIGNAALTPALLIGSDQFTAGVVEHLLGTLPWAVWMAAAGAEMLRRVDR